MAYYFGFRVKWPTGAWVVEGPFKTADEVKLARSRAKQPDGEVSMYFLAESAEAAKARLDSGMGI